MLLIRISKKNQEYFRNLQTTTLSALAGRRIVVKFLASSSCTVCAFLVPLGTGSGLNTNWNKIMQYSCFFKHVSCGKFNITNENIILIQCWAGFWPSHNFWEHPACQREKPQTQCELKPCKNKQKVHKIRH